MISAQPTKVSARYSRNLGGATGSGPKNTGRRAPGPSVPAGVALGEVDLGTTVEIKAVAGESATCLRLLEVGFTPGQSITPLARAPFGGPLAIALRGTIMALRPNEAACIIL